MGNLFTLSNAIIERQKRILLSEQSEWVPDGGPSNEAVWAPKDKPLGIQGPQKWIIWLKYRLVSCIIPSNIVLNCKTPKKTALWILWDTNLAKLETETGTDTWNICTIILMLSWELVDSNVPHMDQWTRITKHWTKSSDFWSTIRHAHSVFIFVLFYRYDAAWFFLCYVESQAKTYRCNRTASPCKRVKTK